MNTAVTRAAVALAGTAVLLSGAVFAPLGLRTLDTFTVQRVEVFGAHHMTADAVLSASGITTGTNVFEDVTPWVAALRRHPLVADVRIERRLPRTLVLHIREAVPIAYARTPELRPIDRAGRVLPANAADDEMDLPVLTVETKVSATGRAADAHTRRITEFLGLLADTEPGLVGWISEVGVHGDAIRLVLRNATDVEVLVPAAPDASRLRELHITLSELATMHGPESDLSGVRRIDARFDDQIVVRMHGRKS